MGSPAANIEHFGQKKTDPTSLPAGQKTASLIPHAVHKIVPGTGHACCIEDPAGFDALVIDFLKSLRLMPELTDG